MKVIKLVTAPHPCMDLLANWWAEQPEPPYMGTVVECDCGNQFRLGQQTWIQVSWVAESG